MSALCKVSEGILGIGKLVGMMDGGIQTNAHFFPFVWVMGLGVIGEVISEDRGRGT